ncbi:MAG: hypothetical protein MUO52_02405 [Desulfobacterales bacterium]|nr:hypothetical protein [Desulfobacterales bacterium]
MDLEPRKELKALQEMRELALLLSLGNVYLCEEVFLRKIGRTIESTHKRLETEILSLKERFPGKFAIDVNTDKSLKELQVHADQMQNPETGISDRCMAGELGRALEKIVGDLTAAVKVVRSKVAGDLPTYSRRASLFDLLEWVKAIGTLIKGLWKLLLKIVIILLIIVIGPVTYLSLTTEETGPYEKEVHQSRAHIQAQRETITAMERQRGEINQKISALSRPDLTREERIDIMGLMVAIHGLAEKRNKVEVDIADHENRIKHNQEKIDEIEKKPYLKRLFRF